MSVWKKRMKIWKDRCNDILRDDSGMGVVEIILIIVEIYTYKRYVYPVYSIP